MQRGVTLVEMLIVVAIIAVMVGITFPAVSSGIDSLRLISAADSLVSFLNGAMGRAERRQEAIEITVSKPDNSVSLRSTEPGYERKLEMPTGVTIENILPLPPLEAEVKRSFLLYPGGAVPRMGIEIANRRGSRRTVRVNPLTGVPQVEQPESR